MQVMKLAAVACLCILCSSSAFARSWMLKSQHSDGIQWICTYGLTGFSAINPKEPTVLIFQSRTLCAPFIED
jgi:hypothetical protein